MMNKLVIKDGNIKLKETEDISLKIRKASKFIDVTALQIKIKKDIDLAIEYDCEDIKLDITINILKGVKAHIYEIKKDGKYKLKCKFNLEKDASLIIEKINDVKQINELTVVNLNGENAKVDYILKTISKYNEKYNFLVYHNAKKTTSDIKNNGVNILEGILEFNVSSFVPKGIIKCDASQSARIINETKNICAIKPNLFIDEQDVSASHSALIGTFSKDEIFYLMSRGIDEKKSQKILSKGFLLKGITLYKDNLESIINKYWG